MAKTAQEQVRKPPQEPTVTPLQPQTGTTEQAATITSPSQGQPAVRQKSTALSAKKAMLERQKRFLEALKSAQGNISMAAQLASIDRDNHWRWMANKEYAERFGKVKRESKQARVDMALARVVELVAKTDHKDSFAAAKLVLENEGQDYGYGQKPGTNVQVNTQVNTGPNITADQFREIARKTLEAKYGKLLPP